MRRFVCVLTILFALGLFSTAAPAQTAAPAGYKAEVLGEVDYFQKRFTDLSERVPEDKYGWRPGEGVRSIGEVFLHVAAANYNLPRNIGTPPPADFKAQGFDKSITEKAKIVETVKQSFAHMRGAVEKLSDADMEKPLKLFGRETTYRYFLLFMMRHLGEHLGQSIAYARQNGVVPPWTEERMRQQQQRPQ